jgi:D-glycero-alpha-D-manno-heptose-7-phosphate kinase
MKYYLKMIPTQTSESQNAEELKIRNVKALILAGGFGTRLKSVVSDVPKPMALVAGKPFLEYQIGFLKEQGITEIIIAVHHMADKIKSYFGDGKNWGVEITYSDEEYPLGTAGAIKKAERYLEDTFIVLNGDTYSPINIGKLLSFHKAKRSLFTLALANSAEVSQSGTVVLEGSRISQFLEKSADGEGLVNRGIYVFEPKVFDYIEEGKKVSLEQEIFPKLASQGVLFGYEDSSSFIDIGSPGEYKKLKKKIIEEILVNEDSKIKDVLEILKRTGINLSLVINRDRNLLGVLNDRIVKEHLLRGGTIEDGVAKAMVKDPITAKASDNRERLDSLLISGIHHLPIIDELGKVVDVEFSVERIKSEVFPVIRGRAPLRISFSGGGSDIPLFFEKFGGAVINSTIDKYCHASLIKRADSKIIINSDLLDNELIIHDRGDLVYDGNLDIIKAVINVVKPDFGFELHLHNDLPPGRGLGSSASLAVLLVSLLCRVQNLDYDDYRIAELAHEAEREELKIKGGWQDQYAAITGGFSFMEFNKENTVIYPLRLKEDVIEELNSRLILCYVGSEHRSGELHQVQEGNFIRSEEEVSKSLIETKKITSKIKNLLLTNNLEEIGSLLHSAWLNKKQLSSSISNPKIDHLYEVGLRNGAQGGKLLGAGGGGYILFYLSPDKRNQLKRELHKEGGEVLNFKFDTGGTRIWQVKGKSQ